MQQENNASEDDGVVPVENKQRDVVSSAARVEVDIASKAIMFVEDAFEKVSFRILKTVTTIQHAEAIKGSCIASFEPATGQVTLDYDLKLKLKFEVLMDGAFHRGWLVLVHTTPSFLQNPDFPIEIQWINGISPTGITFIETRSILLSPRCRTLIRARFAEFERVTVTEMLPRMQGLYGSAAAKLGDGKDTESEMSEAVGGRAARRKQRKEREMQKKERG